MNSFEELLAFRSYRTLTGQVEPVELYRRNGRLAVRFLEPLPSPQPEHGISPALWAAVTANLTDLERQTWWKLLGGRLIPDIAAEEGVRRSAIYCRIRGKNGAGGMVAKNPWVRAWWHKRQSRRSA